MSLQTSSSTIDSLLYPDYVECTTLLKSVPFVDIDKDENEEILQHFIDLEEDLEFVSEHSMKLYKFTGVDSGEYSIRVGPVLQLESVIISKDHRTDDGNDFKIFGEISVPDDNNNIFYIYKRELDNPERVTPGNHLFLNGCTVSPVMVGKLKFSLTDKDRGRQLFEGDYDAGALSNDEEKCTLQLYGEDGYRASVVFNRIRFAAIAKVEMYLFDGKSYKGQVRTSYKVYGRIKVNDIVCFQKQYEEAVEMEHGEYNGFGQSRCVFAVPAYKSLLVKIELFSGEHEEIADNRVEFRYPYDCSWPTSFTSNTACKDERYCFGMEVEWIPHDDYFRGSCFGVWADDLKVKWSSRVGQVPPHIAVTSAHLVEVFSVCIAGGDSSALPLALCGTIVVQDGGGTDYIFSRYKILPDKLSSDEQKLRHVSLTWPIDRWILLDGFHMHLKLKDNRDNRVCRGGLRWREDIFTRYDVRMCDVIRGENGYFAAVHYSAFKDASRAKVSIKWEGSADSLVYGSVIAQYKNYVYPSTYYKEYYRSIIFKRTEEDRLRVKKDSEIPLSKSLVAAPSDCEGLIIHVKLCCAPVKFHVGFLKPLEIVDEHLFEARLSNATPRQLGCMLVNVEWFPKEPVALP